MHTLLRGFMRLVAILFLLTAVAEGYFIHLMDGELARQASIADSNAEFYRRCAIANKYPLDPQLARFSMPENEKAH